MIGPFYLTPATARALLALSRARRAHRVTMRGYIADPGTRTYDALMDAARTYAEAREAVRIPRAATINRPR